MQKPLPTKFSDETGNYDGNDPQGSANLTFTRNSNASRVNADGKVELVRTNLVLQSNDFSSASWSKLNNATVSATRVADPFGGTTAWQIIYDGTTDGRIEQVVSGFSGTGTQSAWLRVASGTQEVKMGATSGSLTTSVVTTTWTRFSATTTSGNFPRILCNASTTIEVYGCQFEASDFGPTAYIPTTTSARSTFAGISVDGTSVPNVPRLDYSGGGCSRLILESQRTNFLEYSEDFSQTAWTKTFLNIETNSTTSPSGYLDADKLVPNTTFGQHKIDITKTVSSGASVALSAFVKKGEYLYCCLYEVNSAKGRFFDLSNGVEAGVFGSAPTTSEIQAFGNDWYKISITTTVPSTSARYILYVCDTISSTALTGDGTSGIYAWGAQLEAGSYATSYIPTLGASVTRLADAAYKTGISSLIGQTEGTLFREFVHTASVVTNVDTRFSISDNSAANWIFVSVPEDGTRVRMYVRTASSTYVDLDVAGQFVDGQRYKVAMAYKSGDSAIYINGTQVATNSDGFASPSNPISVAFFSGDGNSTGNVDSDVSHNLSQALLFKTRLTNAQLAELTTL